MAQLTVQMTILPHRKSRQMSMH